MAKVPISGPITNLQEAQTALLIGFIDELALTRFVIAYLGSNPDLYGDRDLAEIAHINQKRRDEVLKVPGLLAGYIAREFPDFDPERDASQSMARAFLKQLLEEFLRKQDEPCEACRYVTRLESIYRHPVWLGNLYEMCEWQGERLRQEAEALVTTL